MNAAPATFIKKTFYTIILAVVAKEPPIFRISVTTKKKPRKKTPNKKPNKKKNFSLEICYFVNASCKESNLQYT